MTIARQFTQHMSNIGRKYLGDGRDLPMGASTDMGMSIEPLPLAEN